VEERAFDPIVVASAFRLQGVNFQRSAGVLAASLDWDENDRPKRLTALPFYLLVSYAAELFLKAALLKRGWSEHELKRFELRHNLSALAAELASVGVALSPRLGALLDQLSKQHATHQLRYTVLLDNGEKTFLPPRGVVLAALDELLSLTRISTQGR